MDFSDIFLRNTDEEEKYVQIYHEWKERDAWYRKTPTNESEAEHFKTMLRVIDEEYHDAMYDEFYATLDQEWREEEDLRQERNKAFTDWWAQEVCAWDKVLDIHVVRQECVQNASGEWVTTGKPIIYALN